MLLSAEIQFSFFPLSFRCFDDENEALSFDLVLPLLWSMLRFSLELLDLIELDLLIDESTDWDNMSSFDVDVFCESCLVLANYFSTKKKNIIYFQYLWSFLFISNLKTHLSPKYLPFDALFGTLPLSLCFNLGFRDVDLIGDALLSLVFEWFISTRWCCLIWPGASFC